MRSHLNYFSYVVRHKWFVLRAGLRTHAPFWRLLIHDWTKFLPCEWNAYVRRFYSGRAGLLDKSGDGDDFHRAWTHHWHMNAHHWEHWLAFNGDGTYRPMRMPENFVREMVADWMGAGRAITGKWEVADWYAKSSANIVLHSDTRSLVQQLIIAHQLQQATVIALT